MKHSIFFLLSLLCFCQCSKKDAEGDLSGKEYIRGRLFLFDNLTQNANGLPLGEKKVIISYENSTDTLNYLFSTMTNKEGYFIFPNLKYETLYRLYYEESAGGTLYRAKALSMAPNDSLKLNAYVSTTGQNGLHLTVLDENDAVLKGVSVCLFNSPLLFGYTNNECVGNSYSLTSDASGHAFKFSIPPGSYYLNSSLDINGFRLTAKDTIIARSDRIVFDTIRLKQPNGIKFTVLDPENTRLAGASLCVFTSLALYQRDTCLGSNFQLTSSINGEAARYSLFPQRYYILCTYAAGDTIWIAKDTIDLNTQIVHDTLKLRKK